MRARGNSLRGPGCSFIFPRKKKECSEWRNLGFLLLALRDCGDVTWNGVFALVQELSREDAVAEREGMDFKKIMI